MMAISTAESVVMEALWRRSPLSAEDIFAEVGEAQGWALPTLKTLLARLVEKDALATEKDGRRFLYRPLVARDDYMLAEGQTFLGLKTNNDRLDDYSDAARHGNGV